MVRAVINLSAKSPVLPEFPPYGVCILESRHTEGFVMSSSCYHFSEIMLILDGKGSLNVGKIRHPVAKGNLVIMPAGTTYSYTDSPTDPLAMLSLCIIPSENLADIFQPVLPSSFLVIRNTPFTREVIPNLRAILYEQSKGTVVEVPVVIAHTLLILSKVRCRQESAFKEDESESSIATVQFLARVRDYIAKLDTAFHETETIRAVAERLGMSSRSLTDYFRQITGLSRHQYIQDLRLKQAQRMLTESNESITAIAFACGFEDLSSFFRAFRRKTKTSASQWRQSKGNRVRSM